MASRGRPGKKPNSGEEHRGRKPGRVNPNQTRKKARTPSPNTRIDPKSLPKLDGPNIPPSAVNEYHSNLHNSKVPPRCRANTCFIDEGCATPRFVRLTQHLIPSNITIANNTGVCLGAIIRPLAEVGPQEEPVPLTEIPNLPRCSQCWAYINAYCSFPHSGHSWRCSLCDHMNVVPDEYYCATDGKGQRTDRDIRPELHRGSVDIVAPKQPDVLKKPNFLFILDISKESHDTGFLTAAINGIYDGVDAAFPEGTTEAASIGVICFDSVVKVLTPNGLCVMNDIDDPFLPVPYSDALVSVQDSERLNSLLENLNMEILKPTSVPNKLDPSKMNSCFGAAVKIAEEILQAVGGRVVCNILHLPNCGVGTLVSRDDRNLYGTKKEKTLLKPHEAWYRNLVDRCALENSISFDLFFGGAKYCDILTLSELSHFSGGSLFHYPNFNYSKDSESFSGDLSRVLTRYHGLDAYVVIRTSPGVVLHECYGGFSITNRDQQELRLATVNSDTTFLITLEHDNKLDTEKTFVMQVAMLYTPRDSPEALIRLHTVSRKINSSTTEVFRQIDLETVMTISAKMTVETILNRFSENDIKTSLEQLVAGCTNVLCKYRQHCAKGSHRGQLILPDTLKLMPLYTLGLLKNPMLHSTLTIDERIAALRYLGSCPMAETLTFMYPNMYRIDNIDLDAMCFQNQLGYYQYPCWMQITKKKLGRGIYLMNTSRMLYLCIAPSLPHEIFDSLFYQDAGEILMHEVEPEDDGSLLGCMRSLIDEITFNSSRHLSLQILMKPDKQSANIDETKFLSHMIDDAPLTSENTATTKISRKNVPFKMDYTDFLVYCHNQVRKRNPI